MVVIFTIGSESGVIFQPLFRVMPSVGIAKEICSSTNSKLISVYSLACNVFFTIYMDRKRRDVKKKVFFIVYGCTKYVYLQYSGHQGSL